MSLASSIYRWAQADGLTATEAIQRNAEARRAIWQATGWACVDLDAITCDWTRQAIINECVKQNGQRGR